MKTFGDVARRQGRGEVALRGLLIRRMTRKRPQRHGHRMHFELKLRVDNEPAAAFALLSDPRQRPRWQGSLSAVEMLDEGEPRLGMRWRERPYGMMPVSLVISAFERDALWEERFDSLFARGTFTLRFSSMGQRATELAVRAAVELRGPAALGAPLAKPLLMREIQRDLRRVQELLRSAAA